MDGKMLARIGAIMFVAVAITATAIELTRKDDAPTSSPMPQLHPATDPLRASQRRCQQLGWAFEDDNQADAIAVWAYGMSRIYQMWQPRMGILSEKVSA